MRNKTMLKRVTAAAMAFAMTAGLAACGNSGGKDQPAVATTAKDETSGSAGAGAIDTSSHETITMLVLGNKPSNGRLDAMLEELNKILTDKANAELALHYIEWADWQTQYNTQLLSGDSKIDIITTATDWLYGWENAQKGAFLPLSEEMLKTYAPKTWEQVDAKGNWDICKLNGEIMFIPEDHYTQYTNHGFMYRTDWAKEAGLADGKVQKLEDMTTYFKYIKENKEGVIPWDAAGKVNTGGVLGYAILSKTNWKDLIGVNAGNYALWLGTPDDPYTVGSPYMEDDVIYEVAEIMKEWNDLGVWREDVLNYDGDTREQMFAGNTATDQHHSQTYYSQVRPQMDLKQPGSEVQFYFFGQESKNLPKPMRTHGAAAINYTSKHPERALMVYDLLRNDEECYRLLNYGIEGTDYIVTDDGKLDYPEGWDRSKDALDSNFWCGRNDDLELENKFWWDGWKGMVEEYNSFAYEYPFENLIIDKNKIEAQQAAFANILSEYIPQLAYGKYEDPRAKIDEMREKLKAAGYDEVKASIQADMDAFKAANQ